MPTVTDVLILGGGAAGASAAIAARNAGAEVIVAEKTAAPGGSCPISGGFLLGFDGPGAEEHIDALCFGKTPPDVISAYVEGLRELPGWLGEECGDRLSDPLPPMEA